MQRAAVPIGKRAISLATFFSLLLLCAVLLLNHLFKFRQLLVGQHGANLVARLLANGVELRLEVFRERLHFLANLAVFLAGTVKNLAYLIFLRLAQTHLLIHSLDDDAGAVVRIDVRRTAAGESLIKIQRQRSRRKTDDEYGDNQQARFRLTAGLTFHFSSPQRPSNYRARHRRKV